MDFRKIFDFIPEVVKPLEKKVGFNVKLKWTLVILGAFFILANIPLFGLSENALARFEYLAIILGTDFGSIISLGIGPIVMASIILQLLTGSGILNIDTTTIEGKKFFQGIQKILVFFFIIFEAIIYVSMQGLQASPGFAGIVIFQLILGGLAIFYMDDLVSKWGFGSGISLFIAAGVSGAMFWQIFSPPIGINAGGILFKLFTTGELLGLLPIIAVVVIFLIVVFAEGMHVNIPITMGHRGTGGRYPVKFLYVSNMPVILAMALFMNVRLWALFVEKVPFVGEFFAGLAWAVNLPNIGGQSLVQGIIYNWGNFAVIFPAIIQGIIFIFLLIIACIVFGWFWVQMGNQSTEAVAAQLERSGMQIPGFRKDKRVIEKVLNRYIPPITILGSIFVALLAGLGDMVLSGLASGTGILLTVGIIYRFYEEIAKSQAEALAPFLGKL